MKLQQGHKNNTHQQRIQQLRIIWSCCFKIFHSPWEKRCMPEKATQWSREENRSIQHFQVASCLHRSYLPEVPCARTDLFFCAVVNPACVIQNILLPLLFIVQEHCVLWEDMMTLYPHAVTAQTDSFFVFTSRFSLWNFWSNPQQNIQEFN